MSADLFKGRPHLGLFVGMLAWTGLLPGAALAAGPHPVVAGFERFGDDPRLGPSLGGTVLLGELGCTACHRAEGTAAAWVDRKVAPVLEQVGSRVRPGYLRTFLADPHGVKPGTTMPDVLGHLPEEDRRDAAVALGAWLETTGQVVDRHPSPKAVQAGRVLYRQVGCVACHGPLDPDADRPVGSVPLGELGAKYTVPGLGAFLFEPHQARPSGRMPGLRLTRDAATAVASALLAGQVARTQPNLAYTYYEGKWDHLPDFDALTPVASGQCLDLDPGVTRRHDEFALRFRGTIRVDREGDYTFHLRSDDGGRLRVDDAEVVNNDGIHPPTEAHGQVHLAAGRHLLSVEFLQGTGDYELEGSWEGPGLPRQELSPEPLDGGGTVAPTVPPPPDPAIVARGRDLFATLGCASCHAFREGEKVIEPGQIYAPLANLRPGEGCLATEPKGVAPRYGLDEVQRGTLTTALAFLTKPEAPSPTPKDLVTRSMAALNCYACHARDGLGGPGPEGSGAFETTQAEMGDEGRIPPLLDGVGAKLRADYLAGVLAEGAKERPYMLTRMPKFGASVAGGLGDLFAKLDLDAIPTVPPVEFSEPARKVKAAGRLLVGSQSLSCVACHTFQDVRAQGIQAIDMTTMTRRLRRDWFFRYLPDPAVLRPGTRMPSSWPEGQSVQPSVLNGSTPHQIEAIWDYLSDGRDAAPPVGLGRDPIPLVPTDSPIVYRNFIKGVGPRAIGVGYPEQANLAFDANNPRLALIWQGGFIDAARHWIDRGEGFQPPMGDNILALPAGPAFGSLANPEAAWPDAPAARFRGYRLDSAGRPTFLYDVGDDRVEDTFTPLPPTNPSGSPGFSRSLVLNGPAPETPLTFRAAVVEKVEPLADGWYDLGGGFKMRLSCGDARPIVRQAGGKAELLIPVEFREGRAKIVQDFDW